VTPPAADGEHPFFHQPVLLAEVLAHLAPRPGGVYVDATVGGGGHAEAILQASGPDGVLVGIDQDQAALAAAAERLAPYESRVRLLHGNFADLDALLGDLRADGILFDVGVSSAQLDDPRRGFAYRSDAPLDMRMDRERPTTAYHLVNGLDRGELTDILRRYGEERWAARIADFIVRARRREPIATTGQLVDIVRAAVPARARRGPDHPARRTFQALRIAVNGELDALTAGLRAAVGHLRSGGRLVVIAFHSLEDRIVKQTLRALAAEGGCTLLTRKPVRPGPDEVAANPRSRSARLRALAVASEPNARGGA
jgi:16S rRNA (cytosine1402-N4)-methyltransferase